MALEMKNSDWLPSELVGEVSSAQTTWTTLVGGISSPKKEIQEWQYRKKKGKTQKHITFLVYFTFYCLLSIQTKHYFSMPRLNIIPFIFLSTQTWPYIFQFLIYTLPSFCYLLLTFYSSTFKILINLHLLKSFINQDCFCVWKTKPFLLF